MFEKINVSDNHTLFEDRVKNLKNEVVWATEIATQKAMTTYNSWQNRSPIKRFANIFQGDLAKNVVTAPLPEREELLPAYGESTALDSNVFLRFHIDPLRILHVGRFSRHNPISSVVNELVHS